MARQMGLYRLHFVTDCAADAADDPSDTTAEGASLADDPTPKGLSLANRPPAQPNGLLLALAQEHGALFDGGGGELLRLVDNQLDSLDDGPQNLLDEDRNGGSVREGHRKSNDG